ncbi:MAG: sigma-70 family RNA polymerase sigma factor [Luteitalea sp.]|nr:sigma-70 family RNA polymerase sigma factor [Luteitalea sp.]
MLRFPRPTDAHEAWFEEHYAQLMAWALHLTGRDREQAEDLVHDAFVQFMAHRPDLTKIQNPEGYLYTSLRHLQLANARRLARRRETSVSSDAFDLLAHDSLPQGLRAWRAQQSERQDDSFAQQLRDVYRYTQHRKCTAKTASVLLLRFFHGYYPGEIAEVLRLSRPAVGKLLQLARQEARLFMADPDAAVPAAPDPHLFNPPNLVLALRDAALRADPDGACLSDAEIAALYAASGDASVPTPIAAHLVSCAACLDRVNRALGLPPLADRHPLDSVGYDPGAPPPGAGTGTVPQRPGRRRRQRLDEGRYRLSDLLTHRPHELRIAVNGIILGSQAVTASVSRQTIRVAGQPFDFLEVLSEEDVRLLLLSVETPPRGPVEVQQGVELSDGRRLEVHVDFSGDTPVVRVSYVDHALAEGPALIPVQPSAPAAVPSSTLRQRLRRSIGGLFRPRGSGIAPRRWRLTRGGAFLTLVVATAIGAVLLNHFAHPVLSAAELLERSRAAEALWRSSQTHIVRRTLDVEVRSSTGGTTRRRVEVWHSAARGLTVRRAYDERQQLVAGEWMDATGARAVHQRSPAADAGPVLQGLEAWRVEPSADAFVRLIGTVERAVATKDARRFVIAFAADVPPASGVVSASLTLRADWRAVEQRATVRGKTDTTTFTWIERRRPTSLPKNLPADVFDVDAVLRAAPTAPAPAAPAARLIPPATASLEVAALTALRRIDADLGEEVRVRRADGHLSMTGVVASAQRRAQILSVLETVRRDPAAQVRIETVDEVHRRARRGGKTRAATAAAPARESTEPPSFGLARIPLHDEVRASLIAAGVAATEADEEVARAADQVVRQAQAMRLHAWALRRLLDGVSVAEVTHMTEPARAQWRALIGEHARSFLQGADTLSALVRPILPDVPATPQIPAAPLAADDALLSQQARALVNAALRLDELVQAAFVLPASGATIPPPTPDMFWAAVAQATGAASPLDRTTRPSPPLPE